MDHVGRRRDEVRYQIELQRFSWMRKNEKRKIGNASVHLAIRRALGLIRPVNGDQTIRWSLKYVCSHLWPTGNRKRKCRSWNLLLPLLLTPSENTHLGFFCIFLLPSHINCHVCCGIVSCDAILRRKFSQFELIIHCCPVQSDDGTDFMVVCRRKVWKHDRQRPRTLSSSIR